MRKFSLVLVACLILLSPAATASSDEYLDRAVQIVCSSSQGAGFQIDSMTVVTARHVVQDCKSVKILNNSKVSVFSTDIVLSKEYDLAYVKVAKPLVPISTFAKTPVDGSDVYAVGAPIDGLVLSKGKLMGSRRDMEANWLVLEIPADHGNSGGPVYSLQGLIGIVISKNEETSEIYALDSREIQSDFARSTSPATSGQTFGPLTNLNKTLLIQVFVSASMTFLVGLGFGFMIGKGHRIRKSKKRRIRIEV